VQTIMPLRNVRGYALALTTARYYTPSGRSIQRDYASTALEEYYVPRDRKACDEGGGEARMTDAGRRVYGGDGITPDYCVEPETPSKVVSYLIARQALTGFARGYEAAEGLGEAAIAGTGTRSQAASAKVKPIRRDFQVDDEVLRSFREYVASRKLRLSDEDYSQHREEIARRLEEQVLMQVFGEGEARRRTVAWDPQVRKALALVPRAEMLLRDPTQYVAERERERRLADAAAGRPAPALP
jgi:carboxyl-terminal processing protease